MDAGQVISGLGHAVVIGWVLWGGYFRTDPLPFEVTEVAVISSAEFAALSAARSAPEQVTEVAMPVQPEVTPQAVETPATDAAPEREEPAQVAAPASEVKPEALEPEPEPEVAEAAPDAPETPAPPAELAVDSPQVAERAVPKAVPRIAPEVVAPPDPEARPDPVEQAARDEAPSPDALPTDIQEATAPEEAATEIVTEAETPSTTIRQSLRPPSGRPARPVRTAAAAEPKPDTPTPTPSTEEAVAAAVATAMSAEDPAPKPARAAPSGPPLSAGERDALRVAVSRCWNVGSLSSDALQTTVTVAVSMMPDGKPVMASIRMIDHSGGTSDSARQAFETAKRAIIRCGAKGYDLPADKYAQWQEIEMTFNPERMRIR